MFKTNRNQYKITYKPSELGINEEVLHQVVGNDTDLRDKFCGIFVRLNGTWKNHRLPDEEILDAQEAILNLKSDVVDMALVLDKVDFVLQAFDGLNNQEKLFRQDRLLILAFISGAELTGTALIKKLDINVAEYPIEQKAQYLGEVACSGNKGWFMKLLNEMNLTQIPDAIYRNLNRVGKDLVATVRMDFIAKPPKKSY